MAKTRALEEASVGPAGSVETRFFTFGEEGDGLRLSSGERLAPVTLAYETYGELNAARDNAILLVHALTASHHAAGFNPDMPTLGERWTEEMHEGWWDSFIGSGRALDTDRFHVVCANYVGGCFGSTGPTSIGPDGEPYGPRFPQISFADVARSQMRLLDHLGVERLHAVVGASTGGLVCGSLATLFPDRVRHVVLIATGLELTPLQRVHNFEQIQAIENDPHFAAGEYTAESPPERGMMLARQISHKTFISLQSMENRSRREIRRSIEEYGWYTINDPLESYMLHQGLKFARRFDANSYLRILDAWNRFDLCLEARCSDLVTLFERCRDQRHLVFTIDSDCCYYPEEQDHVVGVLAEAGVPHQRVTVHSDKGHDSFLLEPELYTPHLQYTLNLK